MKNAMSFAADKYGSFVSPHLLPGRNEERPWCCRCYRAGTGQSTVEVISTKRSYALKWWKSNNDDDNDEEWIMCHRRSDWVNERFFPFCQLGLVSLAFTASVFCSELRTKTHLCGGRPPLSHILPLPSHRLGRYQIILLDDRCTCVNKLLRVVTWQSGTVVSCYGPCTGRRPNVALSLLLIWLSYCSSVSHW